MDRYKQNKTRFLVLFFSVFLFSMNSVEAQYYSIKDGNWSDRNTWLFGFVIGTPEVNNLNSTSVVIINNQVTVSNTVGVSELIIDGAGKLIVDGDSGLFVNNSLELNGIIDLEGESQLIQTANSALVESSKGSIEIDQQGTGNSYTFNYWSSPVSKIGAGLNNAPFTIADVLRDGSDVSNPLVLNFGGSAFYADGDPTTPKKISAYWLYRYLNNGNNYAGWESMGVSNNFKPTQGFTMKGTSGSYAISDEQNYVFIGKPNNAPDSEVLVHTNFAANNGIDGNISLTGNPFPSAIDANKFINDNFESGTNSITGILYYWEHFGGGSHYSRDYEGAYATYSLAGAVGAPKISEGNSKKVPGQFIPVGQGFYVIASETGGDVVFKNSQRVFEKETNNSDSSFLRGAASETKQENTSSVLKTQRIRLGFDTSKGFHRQVMVAFIEGTTDNIDRGYDSAAADRLKTDALFIQEDINYVILSYGEFNEEREIPLSVIIRESEGGAIQKFTIDTLENITEEVGIFIKDNDTNVVHNLRGSDFEFQLAAGEYNTKYSLVFVDRVLEIPDNELSPSNLVVRMNNSTSEIQIFNNENINIQKVTLHNTLGQQVGNWSVKSTNNKITLPVEEISTGTYIVNTETDNGSSSTKIVIN